MDASVERAPVRIVHLGLGAFHRAHQAVYTALVGGWGIAAFTSRTPTMATILARQHGLYTVVERSDSGDSFSTIASIVEAVDGDDVARLAELVAARTTAVVTLTITEAGYRSDGPVPGRLVAALDARRRAGAGPIAVVPCDNLLDNAGVLRSVLLDVATRRDPALAAWIAEQVSFVNTCVDRITPATKAEDVAEVARRCGHPDDAVVVTEPYREWVLSGAFPAGRPPWEQAGALFVDDIRPYETRKLWFLNGAHSLLAYLGLPRGLRTVDEAIDDPQCRAAVDALWDLAERQLDDESLDLVTYRRQLLQRFANRRISHQLAQIALDGSVKLRNRVVPLVRSDHHAAPALAVLAGWIDYLGGMGDVPVAQDPAAAQITAALALEPLAQTRALLTLLEPSWHDDHDLHSAVQALRQPPRSPS